MNTTLELMVSGKPIPIKPLQKRLSNNFYVALYSVPKGIFNWIYDDPNSSVSFIESLDINDELKDSLIYDQMRIREPRKSLWGHICDSYRELKH